MKPIADTLGVARSNLSESVDQPHKGQERRGCRPLPEGVLLAEIKEVIADLPT